MENVVERPAVGDLCSLFGSGGRIAVRSRSVRLQRDIVSASMARTRQSRPHHVLHLIDTQPRPNKVEAADGPEPAIISIAIATAILFLIIHHFPCGGGRQVVERQS